MFEFKLPDLGEGIHEGELLQWHVAQGDSITEDDPLCDMETDKAAVTIPSPRSGVVSALNGRPGDTIRVGEVLAVIDEKSRAGKTGDGKGHGDPLVEEPPVSDRVIAAPATRRLAREMGIDIKTVTGTGPGGRITPEDLKPKPGDTGNTGDGSRPEPPAGIGELSIPFLEILPLPDSRGPEERIPIRSLRKKTAVKTTSASILVPHVAHMDEIDVTKIEGLRKEFNRRHPDKGRLTLLAFAIKAVVAGLKHYPMFNAAVDAEAMEIVHKKFYHIGFAADTPRGLMVPVVHDADRRSLAGIGRRIRHLAEQAREGRIEADDLRGGTFTITNVGAIGGTHVFPLVNAPQTAILGLGRVDRKPVVKGEKILVRNILPVTLSFDHRAGDGAQAAAFVRKVKTLMEDRLEFMAGT